MARGGENIKEYDYITSSLPETNSHATEGSLDETVASNNSRIRIKIIIEIYVLKLLVNRYELQTKRIMTLLKTLLRRILLKDSMRDSDNFC